ncbi:MAG: protein kinase [Polyangiaceae bacterium]|nr:protein kinase [Polyangiaceae bacterium]
MVPPDRPGPVADADPAMADTLLGASASAPDSAAATLSVLGDSSAPAFDLATGEQAIVPVTVAWDASRVAPGARYEDGPVLGAGGMGEVRLLHDRNIGRHVAGKTLHDTGDPGARQRFLREACVQGQLEHPAIVPVYDLDERADGAPLFTMKRVRGQTLGKILERLAERDPETERRHTRRRLLAAFVQVCHAVEYAHERGVVHRDIKPGNIMLGDHGEVYLLDWGVAQLLREADVSPEHRLAVSAEGGAGLTRQGDIVGSLGYMAPEQTLGDPRLVGAHSDVFALGVVLYEILTLAKFRPVAPVPAMVERMRRGEARRASEARPDVPPELDDLCLRCTALSAAERLASAGALALALEGHLEGDRDREARRASAHALTREARCVLASEGVSSGDRVEAMRKVVRALALDPEAAEAQALLVDSLLDPKGPPPVEAEAEVTAYLDALRVRGSRLGAVGYSTMLASVPFAIWIGVKSWPAVGAMASLTCACAAFAYYGSRVGGQRWHSAVLALLTGLLMAATSAVAGPFVAVPALAAGIAAFFAVHVTAEERRVATTLIALGTVAPFAVEWLGWFPPAYSFEPDRILLYARGVEFPAVPMVLALCYATVTSVVLPALFTGWAHDERVEVQRRLIVQAWQLRQLFPAREATPSLRPSRR